MRHLLTTILVVALASFIFTTCHNSIKASAKSTEEVSAVETEETVESRYYGDTLYQYDGKTIVYDYGFDWEERPTSLSTSAIITYRDTTPIDTAELSIMALG